MLVAEGHRFQREDRFAGLVHRLDLVLATLRGNYRAKPTVITNDYSYPSGHSDPRNPRDKRGRLRSDCADADSVRLATITARIADIDVGTTRGEIYPGLKTQRDVAATGSVVKERSETAGCVAKASCVAKEGIDTGGRVVNAGCVARERIKTRGRVVVAFCIVGERLSTGCRILAADCVAKERVKT